MLLCSTSTSPLARTGAAGLRPVIPLGIIGGGGGSSRRVPFPACPTVHGSGGHVVQTAERDKREQTQTMLVKRQRQEPGSRVLEVTVPVAK